MFSERDSLHAGQDTVLTHNRIAGNVIQGCGNDGLALEAEGGAALTHNVVISNSVSFSVGASGLRLGADSDGVVSDNLLQGNVVYHNAENGISLTSGANDNRILHNEALTNNNVGILVAGDANLIVGNWAHDNTRTDIADLGEGNKWRNNTYTPTVGWAGGQEVNDVNDVPAIVHTADGGLTWQLQDVFPAFKGCQVTDISAVDDQTAWATLSSGFVIPPQGAILHTTDGGATWVEQTIPAGLAGGMKGVKGLSRNEAWAVAEGGTVLHTTDGGATWNIVPNPGVPIIDVNRIDALDSGDVWIADENASSGNPSMIHTPDHGLTWRQESLPGFCQGRGPHAISAYSPLVAWGAMQAQGDLYRTVDGGDHWLNVAPEVGAGSDFDDICAADLETVWGVQTTGNSGTIYRVHIAADGSVDRQTFQPADTNYSYEGATCRNDGVAWAVGLQWLNPKPPLGVIVSTVDGGKTWVQGTGPMNIGYWKVSFVGARR
jgi:parallel beta-helix repeat protein